jgi:HNH endonuclease
MPCWTTQRLKARERDGDRCRLCCDTPDSPYCRLQVHHIHPRAEGRTDDLDNLVTLCDLCHAVCHWHMGPAWCGVSKMPLDQQQGARAFLAEVEKIFQYFLLYTNGMIKGSTPVFH